jgi:YVTN family beta-propeller protein
MNLKEIEKIFFICFFLIAFSFAGCTTTEETGRVSRVSNTQIALYLNGPEKASLDITFEVLAVHIISEDGNETEVMSQPQSFNSSSLKGRQVLLGEKVLPEGKYEKIRLTVKQAFLQKEEKTAHLALPAELIEIDINVLLQGRQSATLFLNWNADASVHEGYMFNPVFFVKSQVPELSSLLIYVTNEDSNNVSVINRQSGDIAATIMVGKKPRGIVASKRGGRLKVYVANSGSNSISVIDPTTHKIENEIPVRFGREPEGIAVAEVSPDKELLFVANYGSDNVSVVDTITFQELEKINVGRSPIAIAADPPVEELMGARFLSFDDINTLKSFRERFFNVYVVNHDSNNVSVLRIDKVTNKSEEVITLDVDWKPIAIDVDYQRGKVYIANYSSDKVSVIDILQIVRGNTSDAVITINNVGFSITGVIADPVFDRVYLLQDVADEIMVIRPFTKKLDALKTVMPPITGIIPVGSSPRSFVLGPEARKLYVVNRGSDNVSVIDKTTKKEEQLIPVGRRPYGIVVFSRK